ncbi:MAG: DHH family phosphoesterase [Psittacicella sp.]
MSQLAKDYFEFILSSNNVKKEDIVIDSSEEAYNFIKNYNYNFDSNNIEKALSIIKSIDRVICAVDYDADGLTSGAIFYHSFKTMGYKTQVMICNRKDGYGIKKSLIDSINHLSKDDEFLFITADVGSSDVEAISYFKQKFPKAKIIITDHHLYDKNNNTSFIADAFINPVYKDDLYYLSGCGVAWSLMKYFVDIDTLLNYVSISLISDMMPMNIKLNRSIIKVGLDGLSKKVRLKEVGISNHITPTDIGFKIAPMLNSLSRLNVDMSQGLRFLLSNDANSTRYLIETNELRKLWVSKLSLLLHKISDNLYSIPIPMPGVVGLLAAKLNREYNIPIVVICPSKYNIGSHKINSFESEIANYYIKNDKVYTEDGFEILPKEYVGSGRGSDIYNYIKLLDEHFNNSELTFGGHANAMGLKLDEKVLDKFSNFFIKNPTYKSEDKGFIFEVNSLDPEIYKVDELLEPFGVNFQKPVLKIKVNKIYNKSDIINLKTFKHTYFTINKTIDCKYFNVSLESDKINEIDYVLGHINMWNGKYYLKVISVK